MGFCSKGAGLGAQTPLRYARETPKEKKQTQYPKMNNDRRIDNLFPLPANGKLIMPDVPDASEEPMPPGLIVHMVLTPQLQAKLEEWQSRTGVPMYELGNTIMRLGMLRLSVHIDEENARIKADNVKELIPDGQTEAKT
jgi:hypothetical protein